MTNKKKMKFIKVSVIAIFFTARIMVAFSQNPIGIKKDQPPVKIIFETDMCTDVDDVGALATLHALADLRETEILAIGYNEVHRDAAGAIDAINTWYGRGDIPVGVYRGDLLGPDSSGYLPEVVKFPHDLPEGSSGYPDAMEMYVRVLEAQPDSSVTIVSVGFLNNLANLLELHFDLIARKVQKLVIMGGLYDDVWNLVRHDLLPTSDKIFKQWPTPIFISEEGANIHTGQLLETTSIDNPVRAAYYHYFNQAFKGRSSWDQVAVLFAVRGLQQFTLHADGEARLGQGYPIVLKTGWRSYIRSVLSPGELEKMINELMAKPPGKH